MHHAQYEHSSLVWNCHPHPQELPALHPTRPCPRRSRTAPIAAGTARQQRAELVPTCSPAVPRQLRAQSSPGTSRRVEVSQPEMTKAEQHGRKAAAWAGQGLSSMQRAERTLRDTVGAAQQSAAEGHWGRQELKVPTAAFSSTWQDGTGTHCVGTERQELPFTRPSYGASIPAAPSRQMCFTARPDLGRAEISTIAPCFSRVCHLWDGHSQECPRAEGMVTFGIPCTTFAP